MIASKLKRQLLRALDPLLAESGFQRVSEKFFGDRYSRESNGFRYSIHLSFRIYSDAVVVEIPSLTMCFARVEETIARYEDPDPLAIPHDIADRPTLHVRMDSGSLWGLLRKTWMIRAEEEVAKAARQVAAYALEKAEPVFARFTNADTFARVLIDDEAAKLYMAPDYVRVKKAIAATLIVEGREAAKRVAEAKLATLKGDAHSEVELWFDRLWSDIGPTIRQESA